MSASPASVSAQLERFGFGAPRIAALLEHRKASARELPFAFPWNGLEEHIGAKGAGQLHLLGYGSLLNPVSAARTIKDTPPTGHPPVLAIGARRIFNYSMPQGVFDRYGVQPSASDRAALNAEPDEFGVINGRLITLSSEDVPALRIREKAYDLQPVSCLMWDNREQPPFTAYVLYCRHEWYEGERYVDDSLSPYMPYYDLCRSGAAMVSETFLDLYLQTTYLTDRKTRASDLEVDR